MDICNKVQACIPCRDGEKDPPPPAVGRQAATGVFSQVILLWRTQNVMSGRSTAPRRSKASHVCAAAHVHKVRSTLRNVTAPRPPTAEPKVAIRLEMNAKRMEGSCGGSTHWRVIGEYFPSPERLNYFQMKHSAPPAVPTFPGGYPPWTQRLTLGQ